jgi:hypothetical protein
MEFCLKVACSRYGHEHQFISSKSSSCHLKLSLNNKCHEVRKTHVHPHRSNKTEQSPNSRWTSTHEFHSNTRNPHKRRRKCIQYTQNRKVPTKIPLPSNLSA